jgi:hypothetical protein
VQYAGSTDLDAAREVVNQFLSVWSWWHHETLAVKIMWQHITGDRTFHSVGFKGSRTFTLPTATLAAPSEASARLALAIYREARGVRSIFYEFLGYFKILNMIQNDGKSQIAWINDNLHKLKDEQSLKRLAVLNSSEPEVGNYLYVSGRCAVAHASVSPVANPDNRGDEARLAGDRPIM